MIQDILDKDGNIIGTIELPDETSTDAVNSQLSLYTYTIPTPTLTQIVSQKVSNAQDFGQQLLQKIEVDNVLNGLTTAQVAQMITDYASLITMLQTGSLVTALANAQSLEPKDGMTQARLDGYIAQLKTYLGVP